jgi:hypothetical protein
VHGEGRPHRQGHLWSQENEGSPDARISRVVLEKANERIGGAAMTIQQFVKATRKSRNSLALA